MSAEGCLTLRAQTNGSNMPPAAKPMSRTLAIEIATKAMAIINPRNRGLRVVDLLDKHGFKNAPEPELEIVNDQTRLVSWLRETFKTN